MKDHICDKTHKVRLSEAKARRLTKQYDDIRRWYFCDHCGDYHLTHIGFKLAEVYEIKVETHDEKEIHPQYIRDRLRYLEKRQ